MKGHAIAAMAGAFAILATGAAPSVQAQTNRANPGIKAFYGEFVGRGVTKNRRTAPVGKRDRQANVVISGTPGGGFKITWVTIRRVSVLSDRRKTRYTELTFVPTGQPNRWRATISKPITEGGPTALAALHGRTLTVHVMVIDKRGRLHAATYLRTLSRTGMHLVFRRGINALQVRRVAATLQRIKK